MNLIIRPERETERRIVETLTRDAFWDVYHPGCMEHLVIHQLRESPEFIPGLNLVALDGERIIGHIAASLAQVVDSDGGVRELLCIAPLCVHPDYQKQGVGGQLIEAAKSKAREMSFKAFVLFGFPAYYNRFGFRPTREWGITLPGGDTLDEMMLLELYPDALKEVRGEFHASRCFDITQKEADEFDRQFPYREKHVTDTQLKHTEAQLK